MATTSCLFFSVLLRRCLFRYFSRLNRKRRECGKRHIKRGNSAGLSRSQTILIAEASSVLSCAFLQERVIARAASNVWEAVNGQTKPHYAVNARRFLGGGTRGWRGNAFFCYEDAGHQNILCPVCYSSLCAVLFSLGFTAFYRDWLSNRPSLFLPSVKGSNSSVMYSHNRVLSLPHSPSFTYNNAALSLPLLFQREISEYLFCPCFFMYLYFYM